MQHSTVSMGWLLTKITGLFTHCTVLYILKENNQRQNRVTTHLMTRPTSHSHLLLWVQLVCLKYCKLVHTNTNTMSTQATDTVLHSFLNVVALRTDIYGIFDRYRHHHHHHHHHHHQPWAQHPLGVLTPLGLITHKTSVCNKSCTHVIPCCRILQQSRNRTSSISLQLVAELLNTDWSILVYITSQLY